MVLDSERAQDGTYTCAPIGMVIRTVRHSGEVSKPLLEPVFYLHAFYTDSCAAFQERVSVPARRPKLLPVADSIFDDDRPHSPRSLYKTKVPRSPVACAATDRSVTAESSPS